MSAVDTTDLALERIEEFFYSSRELLNMLSRVSKEAAILRHTDNNRHRQWLLQRLQSLVRIATENHMGNLGANYVNRVLHWVRFANAPRLSPVLFWGDYWSSAHDAVVRTTERVLDVFVAEWSLGLVTDDVLPKWLDKELEAWPLDSIGEHPESCIGTQLELEQLQTERYLADLRIRSTPPIPLASGSGSIANWVDRWEKGVFDLEINRYRRRIRRNGHVRACSANPFTMICAAFDGEGHVTQEARNRLSKELGWGSGEHRKAKGLWRSTKRYANKTLANVGLTIDKKNTLTQNEDPIANHAESESEEQGDPAIVEYRDAEPTGGSGPKRTSKGVKAKPQTPHPKSRNCRRGPSPQ